MTRVFVPAAGVASWRERLADPEKHWRLIQVAGHTQPNLYLGWVTCDVASDQEIARAVA